LIRNGFGGLHKGSIVSSRTIWKKHFIIFIRNFFNIVNNLMEDFVADQVSRRGFIQRTAAGAAGLMALPVTEKVLGKSSLAPLEKSRVVVVRHDDALTGTAFNQSVAETMMDSGITNLTGIDNVGEAWKSLFPGITASSVIGIKINCLFSAMSTHPPVANALLNSLRKMQVDGSPFPDNNIIFWDNYFSNMRSAGFTKNTSATGVRYFGTDGNYDATVYPIGGGASQRLSKIITDQIQYLINFSVLKNHWTSGVSLSMKNHYGSIHNVDGVGMHDRFAELPISSINALDPIKRKQVVCICDAIKGTISGGPSAAPQVTPKSLIFSKDPVAHDYIGSLILRQFGCSVGDTSLTNAARHIAAAANQYSLGTCDPNQIERIDISNPTTAVDEPQSHVPNGIQLHPNYPNPFNSRSFINYELPKSAKVRIRLVNQQGQTVRNLVEGQQGPGWFQTVWDGRMDDGLQAPSGVYICVLEAGRVRRSIKMQLVQ
jgi:uncharacterized protein (DUF362 family)